MSDAFADADDTIAAEAPQDRKRGKKAAQPEAVQRKNMSGLEALFEDLVAAETKRREAVEDIKELLKAAPSYNEDPQVLKDTLTLYFQDPEKREKRQAKRERSYELLSTLVAALGHLADTDLGRAAVANARQ